MNLYVGTLFISFILTVVLTPLAGILSRKLHIMDIPSELSIHRKPMPRLGGIAIFIGFHAAMFAVVFSKFPIKTNHWLPAFSGGLILLFAGLMDDTYGLSPGTRFLLQILGGAILVLFGFEIGFIPVLYIAIPLTLFYVVGGVNAVNLVDGMDGMAAGLSAISSLFFFLLFQKTGNTGGMIFSLALSGACAGFLVFNFPKAKIFMGDSGSLFSGFNLSLFAIMVTSKPYDVARFIAPLLILAIPILDTLFAIIRRFRKDKGLFIGDRGHIYDWFLSRGIGEKNVLLLFYSINVLLGVIAVVIG